MSDANPYRAPSGVTDVPQESGDVSLFSWHGRLGRARLIAYGMGANLVSVLPAAMIGGGLVAAGLETAGAAVIFLGYAAALVFAVVLTVRRCHDLGWSGWLSLLLLLPLVNLLFYLLPGSAGANRYGPKPPPNTTVVLVIAVLFPLVFIGGIMAAVALPAYNEYIDNANMAKVNSHYEEGARFVANEMRRHRAQMALGQASELPADAAGWIAQLNPNGVTSPSGAPAYGSREAATPETGTIGVEVSGTVDDERLVVTLVRPAFEDLEAAETAISYTDI